MKMQMKKSEKIILALFLVSTSYFVFQNLSGISWDFSVYVMNAKHWFSGGNYFYEDWVRVSPTEDEFQEPTRMNADYSTHNVESTNVCMG